MKIDSYSFGRIVINKKTYTTDVIIYPGRVDASWWRKEGHLLQFADVAEALQAKPDVLVIGTGYAGVMRVPKETVDRIAAHGDRGEGGTDIKSGCTVQRSAGRKDRNRGASYHVLSTVKG